MHSPSRAGRVAGYANHTSIQRLHGDSWLVAGGFRAFRGVPRGGPGGSSAGEGASPQAPAHSLCPPFPSPQVASQVPSSEHVDELNE